jgi:hypothetical protein
MTIFSSIRLGLAALFGLCTQAHAVFLNPAGTGEVLVYPYYTVNGGNDTLLTVVNTNQEGKAIKVRFLEAYDGRDVFDFNLYLSAVDVWGAAVTADDNGNPVLLTSDNSCTVPAIPHSRAEALPFVTTNFDGSGAQGNDGGPKDLARAREGHIELIEMGILTNATQGSYSATVNTLDTPQNCAQLVAAWDKGGYWATDPTTDIDPPTGGLFGSATIVNVARGTVQSYNADAIAQFYTQGTRGEHTAPDALTPNIASGNSLTATVYVNDVTMLLTYTRAIDAVSAVFMASKIDNEYWSATSMGAASEWVMTYPTKRFYVDPYYVGDKALLPFDSVFGGDQSARSYSDVDISYFDRESQGIFHVRSSCGFICPAIPYLGLSWETQIVTFNQTSAGQFREDPSSLGGNVEVFGPEPPSRVLASDRVSFNINNGDKNGWAELYTGLYFSAASDGTILNGQPVTGFWSTQYVNGNVDGAGVLANYTAAYRHRTRTYCVPGSGSCPVPANP